MTRADLFHNIMVFQGILLRPAERGGAFFSPAGPGEEDHAACLTMVYRILDSARHAGVNYLTAEG